VLILGFFCIQIRSLLSQKWIYVRKSFYNDIGIWILIKFKLLVGPKLMELKLGNERIF